MRAHAMNMVRRFLWRKAGVAAAFAITVLLGDLRTGVSEAAPALKPAQALAAAPSVPSGRSARRGDEKIVLQEIGADVDGPSSKVEPPDDALLVPAIFAWDPDVRFVYYRQISKWM